MYTNKYVLFLSNFLPPTFFLLFSLLSLSQFYFLYFCLSASSPPALPTKLIILSAENLYPSQFSWFWKQYVKWKWKLLRHVRLLLTPWASPWNSPGQNTRVGSLSLLQRIFPTQGSNPGHLHCRQVLYQLSHKGSPRTLEWVAYPFSRGSSQPRNRTRVICIAGGFFTNWAIREAPFTI